MKRSAFPATPVASDDADERGADASSVVPSAPGVRLAHGADEPSPTSALASSATLPTTSTAAHGPWAALADAAAITRFHILLIAAVAALVFGWLMTGRYPWAVAAIAALDWFLINLMKPPPVAGSERVPRGQPRSAAARA